jgi:hypothetical protein
MLPADELAAALRAHLARHNRHVLGITGVTLLTAALLWLVLYGLAHWLTLFGLTAVRGGEAALPPGFRRGFLLAAAALLAVAWLQRWLFPEHLPPDKKSLGAVLADLALAIPRATLAVWGNLSAWLRLSRAEIRLAADLVDQVARAQRIPLQSAPLLIPDERAREKIVFALLLLQVLEVRREDGAHWLHLSPLRSEEMQALTSGVQALP